MNEKSVNINKIGDAKNPATEQDIKETVNKIKTIHKEPMSNGYDHFICPDCGHDNIIVFESTSMQMLADMADKLNCESCGKAFKVR